MMAKAEIHCRSLTREIKTDTTEIKEDATAIKQDTAQILEEIARLQAQLPRDEQKAGSSAIMLQRYLDEIASYAETLVDTTIGYDETIRDGDSLESETPKSERRAPPSQGQKGHGRSDTRREHLPYVLAPYSADPLRSPLISRGVTVGRGSDERAYVFTA
jgi:hypothetical protein